MPPFRLAIGASAAVFGLWHIRPTLSAAAAKDLADGLPGRAAAVLAGCVGTAAPGVLFACVRLGSGGLLAAAAAHRLDPKTAPPAETGKATPLGLDSH